MDIDGHVVELYTPTSVTESVCPHLGAPPITNHAADCERSCEIACELSSSWQPWAAALLLVLLATAALCSYLAQISCTHGSPHGHKPDACALVGSSACVHQEHSKRCGGARLHRTLQSCAAHTCALEIAATAPCARATLRCPYAQRSDGTTLRSPCRWYAAGCWASVHSQRERHL